MLKSLWTPTTVGAMSLPHRLVMAPMTRDRSTREGVPTELNAEYYAQRASHALIITEGTQPSADGQGYLRLVDGTMRYLRRLWDGIEAIPGLEVMGKPQMSVFGITSRTLDVFAIADGLEARGWHVFRDTFPVPAIRFMQSPGHEPYVDRYLADLAEVADLVRQGKLESEGGRATYT